MGQLGYVLALLFES